MYCTVKSVLTTTSEHWLAFNDTQPGFPTQLKLLKNFAQTSMPVFFNLFMIAEPKMTKINFAEPKSPLKNSAEPQLF